MSLYKNPLNMKIFYMVEKILGWPVEPESLLSQLPIGEDFFSNIENEFSMRIRDRDFPVVLRKDHVTIRELVQDIDSQYVRNYFMSESGTYKGLIEVTDFKGKKIESIDHKWKIRGKNLIHKIQEMQRKDPTLTVLDLGCGYNMYKDHLMNVTGVDPYIQQADFVCRIQDFNPQKKYDIIICFGPMNWYTFDEQYRNFLKIKECLSDNGVCYWSHVHNYYKIFQPDAQRAHTWIAGPLDDAFKNNAFYFFDSLWKYNQYFNWTEEALLTLTKMVGLECGEMQYDDCGCYRPPMWRIFSELRHVK